MHAPLFWKEKKSFSTLLLPLAALYGLGARIRSLAQTRAAGARVVCIGNLVAGGAGKTPVALALGTLLAAKGIRAHFLSRGYGGALLGPVRVNPDRHTAREVGDEPLLLARALPTWVARDRVQGALAAIASGAELLILDDGFQNPALLKDVSFLVIDGEYGFGNGRLLPAGPLRETVEAGMKRATAIILLGEDSTDAVAQVPAGLPILRARLEPAAGAPALSGEAVVAFAGIARPRKFHRTLQRMGASVRKMVAFPDHYEYRARDLERLRAHARELGAQLVTTAKDYIRLAPEAREGVTPVPVEAVFEDAASFLAIALPR